MVTFSLCPIPYFWPASLSRVFDTSMQIASRAASHNLSASLSLMAFEARPPASERTFQGLLSSKPGGATGESFCPRIQPVTLRSRSITSTDRLRISQLCQNPMARKFELGCRVGSCERPSYVLCYIDYVSPLSAKTHMEGGGCSSYPIPFIQRSSLTPAAVLPVLELGHAGAGGAEHLRAGCHE